MIKVIGYRQVMRVPSWGGGGGCWGMVCKNLSPIKLNSLLIFNLHGCDYVDLSSFLAWSSQNSDLLALNTHLMGAGTPIAGPTNSS